MDHENVYASKGVAGTALGLGAGAWARSFLGVVSAISSAGHASAPRITISTVTKRDLTKG